LYKSGRRNSRIFILDMKKLLSILLIAIYSTASLGMSVKEFYCCGKLTSVALSFTSDSNQSTCKKEVKDCDCCKTKSHLLKVKDNHVASSGVGTLTTKHFAHSDIINFTAFDIAAFANPQLNTSNGINDPPLLHSSTPTYIFIRVIRIWYYSSSPFLRADLH